MWSKVVMEIPGDFKEYRYPVGFSILIHPTLRSPNPALNPQYKYREIKPLTQSDIKGWIRKYTWSTEDFKIFRHPIQTLVYALVYRNIAWNMILNKDDIHFLESLKYNVGTMYLHLTMNIIYSRIARNSADYFTDERIASDFTEYLEDSRMMNTPTEWFSETSPYLSVPTMSIIGTFFCKDETPGVYTEDSIRISFKEYFYRYLSTIGFIRSQSLSDTMVYRRNSLFIFT